MRLPRHLAVLPLLLTVAAARPAVAAPDVRISEFMAGPARDWDGNGTFSSRDDEWIEIVNGGSAVADLTPYFLTDGDSIPRFGFTGTLAPGAVVLVTGAESVTWERATTHPVFGLSLGNTGDKVMLWRVSGTDTTLVDSYAYLSHEAASDRAVGRGADGGGWLLFDSLNPYTGSTPPLGSGCPPSPGSPNQCGATPTLQASWGKIKATYR